MTSQHDNTPADTPIDRRLFLGAAGALTLAGQAALAQETKPVAQNETPQAKRLSDTIAVMLAGSREEGAAIVCEMVQQEGAAPKVSVVGQPFRTSPQLAALANGV